MRPAQGTWPGAPEGRSESKKSSLVLHHLPLVLHPSSHVLHPPFLTFHPPFLSSCCRMMEEPSVFSPQPCIHPQICGKVHVLPFIYLIIFPSLITENNPSPKASECDCCGCINHLLQVQRRLLLVFIQAAIKMAINEPSASLESDEVFALAAPILSAALLS